MSIADSLRSSFALNALDPRATHSRSIFLVAACAAVLPHTAAAQGAPKPAGTFGLEIVIEEIAPTASDLFTLLDLSTATPGALIGPVFQVPLEVDLDGDGIPETIKINAAENGTTWQSPTAPEAVIATDPDSGEPIVFMPAYWADVSGAMLSWVDFRGVANPTAPNVGAAFTAGLDEIPYRLLDDGAGRIYVVDSIVGAANFMFVNEFDYAGGVPTLANVAAVTGFDTEFQDRMALGADGTTLCVPHSGGVDVFSIPGLALLGTVPMPLDSTGVPYIPYSNIVTGLPGEFDMMLFGGTQSGGAGHTYISWSSTTGAIGPNGGIDPAGALLRPAPGFHEPAVTAVADDNSTVTALLDSLPFGTGFGAVLQVTVTPAGPGPITVTPVLAPFGDPEPAENGMSDPIGFQIGTPFADFFGAVTAGAAGPVGSVAVSPPIVGFLNPTSSPQPLAMSLPGAPGSEFAVTASIGAPTTSIFNVAPGPVITLSGTFPVTGGATSLGTAWDSTAVGGSSPTHIQATAGLPGAVNLQLGAPFFVPAVTVSAAVAATPPFPGPVAIANAGFVAIPAAQTVTPNTTATRTSLNFTVPGLFTSGVTLHPSQPLAATGLCVAAIASQAAYGGAVAQYFGSGQFVTEFLSF